MLKYATARRSKSYSSTSQLVCRLNIDARWEKVVRAMAGTSQGSGWVVSAAYQNSDRYFPFVRFGHSDGGAGAPAESALSADVQVSQAMDQIWSIGAAWAKPSEETYGPGRDRPP